MVLAGCGGDDPGPAPREAGPGEPPAAAERAGGAERADAARAAPSQRAATS
jgi:hypothetical protein